MMDSLDERTTLAKTSLRGLAPLFADRATSSSTERSQQVTFQLIQRMETMGLTATLQTPTETGVSHSKPDSSAEEQRQFNLSFLIDTSASMFLPVDSKPLSAEPVESNVDDKPTRMDAAICFCITVIEALAPTDRVGVKTFDAEMEEIYASKSASNVNSTEVWTTLQALTPAGGTDFETALQRAMKDLDTPADEVENAEHRVILLTDSECPVSDADETRLGQFIQNQAANSRFVTVGVIRSDEASTKWRKLAQDTCMEYYSIQKVNM
jgi:uncharacterized protein with von Willebrand factor type A (vWA) domain